MHVEYFTGRYCRPFVSVCDISIIKCWIPAHSDKISGWPPSGMKSDRAQPLYIANLTRANEVTPVQKG